MTPKQGMNENFFISQKWINEKYIQGHSKPNIGSAVPAGSSGPSPSFGGSFREANKSSHQSLPDSFDWRAKGVVNPIEDQGNCGSCWIFAALAVVESANAIAMNPLMELSEQQVMDCVKPPHYESNGCQGGTADDAYSFVQQFGVVTSKVYPYTGSVGKCLEMVPYWGVSITGYNFLPINTTDNEIMWTIYNKGPVAAILNAGDREFQLYNGGVLTSPGSRDLYGDYNHYISIVGWGNDGGYDYWIVR